MIQMKERADCKERIRPLSDGNSSWSTVLIKYQKTVWLASSLVDQSGVCEETKPTPDGLEHRKPKQIKSPSQAYVDLTLWKDGQRENPMEVESWEDGVPVSPPTRIPQGTPQTA